METTVELLLLENAELKEKVQWLTFFYEKAGQCFGPADSEIYESIREEYELFRQRRILLNKCSV